MLNEVAGQHGVAVTQGDPGTGKTFASGIVERFNAEVLRPEGREHFTVNVAFTGKTAHEMSRASGRPSFTVDGFINALAAGKVRLQAEGESPPSERFPDGEMVIPKGAQVVIRVAEVSFVGAKQAAHLLRGVEELRAQGVQAKLQLSGDTKQMQSIQAGNLFRQVQRLAGRDEVDFVHLDEIVRQKDKGLLEIAGGLNREDRALGENAQEALAALYERGSVVEIPERSELVSAAVKSYLAESRRPSSFPEKAALGERQSVLLVAATNADRRELNSEIRKARIEAEEISEGKEFRVLAPVTQGPTVEGYQPGDRVVFSGERGEDGRMQHWGARLNTEGTVTAVDREQNLVEVTYSFTVKGRDGKKRERTVVKELPAAEMAGRTTLFREEERHFAVGDRIVTLKNDRGLGVQNGSLGTIRELDAEGRVLVDLEGRAVALNLNSYRQVDHAYAVTIHKSQGATVEETMMFAYVRPGREVQATGEERLPQAEQYGRASYNALNVAVTRAQFEARIFTNSLSGLASSVEAVDRKTSTLAVQRRPGSISPRETTDLETAIESLARAMREPGRGVRKMPTLEQAAALVREPGHRIKEPVREIAERSAPKTVQPQHRKAVEPQPPSKGVGRELELALPKKVGLELEK